MFSENSGMVEDFEDRLQRYSTATPAPFSSSRIMMEVCRLAARHAYPIFIKCNDDFRKAGEDQVTFAFFCYGLFMNAFGTPDAEMNLIDDIPEALANWLCFLALRLARTAPAIFGGND